MRRGCGVENKNDARLLEIEDDVNWIERELKHLNERVEFLSKRHRELQVEKNYLMSSLQMSGNVI